MGKKQFSVPANYSIEAANGLYGIKRKTAKGVSWLWDAMYHKLVVSKTYGKIMIAHCSAMDMAAGKDYMTLTDYKGGVTFGLPIYDIIFGADFLYVLTNNPQTKEMEWAYVKEGFQGGKFLGNINFAVRDKDNKHMLPIGTTTINVEVYDGESAVVKRFNLMTATISEEVIPEVPKPVVVDPVTNCRVVINNDTGRLESSDLKTGKAYKRSTSIGEMTAYAALFPVFLGDLSDVPVERVDLMVEIISKIENFGNGLILVVLYERALRGGKRTDKTEILTEMLSDLNAGWFELKDNKAVKGYLSGTTMVVAIRNSNGKSVFTPYDLSENINGALDANDVEAISTFNDRTAGAPAKLLAKAVKADPLHHETSGMLPPYSIRNNPVASKDIAKYSYESMEPYLVDFKIVGEDGAEHTGISIYVTICNGFSYRPKGSGDKSIGLTKTNMISVAIG